MDLPITRSARIKVDFDLIKKDPQISAQLKEIIRFKQQKGAQIIEEGKKDNLISERTYQANRKRLERWVDNSYKKVDERNEQRQKAMALVHLTKTGEAAAIKKAEKRTQEELIREVSHERLRLSKLLGNAEERVSVHSLTNRQPSGRSQSARSKYSHRSWKGEKPRMSGGPNYVLPQYPSQRDLSKSDKGEELDPYGHHLTVSGYITGSVNNQNLIGSARGEKSKLVQMINSSRTSQNNQKKDKSGSDSV